MEFRCVPTGGGDRTPRLRIEVDVEASLAVVAIVGEIDIATLPALEDALDAVCRDGHQCVELHLAGVGFMCAHALAVLERTRDRLAESGGKLVVLDPSPVIRRILAICAQDNQLDVH